MPQRARFADCDDSARRGPGAVRAEAGGALSLSRNEWACTPHAYDYRHPNYPCAKCGFWPGDDIHQVQAL